MKMEVTMGQFSNSVGRIIQAATIYAGPAKDIPTGTLPNPARANGLPTQVPVNLQGQVSSCYFEVNRALRAAGMP